MASSRIDIPAGIYGPEDPSLLTFQHSHRSNDITTANLDEAIKVRHSGARVFWDLFTGGNGQNHPHSRVLDILHRIGFYGVYRTGRIQMDDHLITALLERWRPETHTFHFRVGEATVTLQDIAIIWGLPIHGSAVCDVEVYRDRDAWRAYCLHYLGFLPEYRDIDGSFINGLAVGLYMANNPVTDDSPDEHVERYTRCCALLLLGGVMCLDASGRFVSLLCAQKLENLLEAGNYSWGSAVLGFLYRELCSAAESEKKNIGGATALLQIWAYMRIRSLAPLLGVYDKRQILTLDGRILPVPPYGGRWRAEYTFTHTATHSVRIIREMLDHMVDSQFIWQPYNLNEPDILAYVDGDDPIWRSKCPLIFYWRVEMHNPERVLRQFGMVQFIPDTPEFMDSGLHKVNRTGRTVDWPTKHGDFIERWNHRELYIQHSMHFSGRISKYDNYDRWYDKITRRFISPTMHLAEGGFPAGQTAELQYVLDQMGLVNISVITADRDPNTHLELLHQVARINSTNMTLLRRSIGQVDEPAAQSRAPPVTGDGRSTRRRRHNVMSSESSPSRSSTPIHAAEPSTSHHHAESQFYYTTAPSQYAASSSTYRQQVPGQPYPSIQLNPFAPSASFFRYPEPSFFTPYRPIQTPQPQEEFTPHRPDRDVSPVPYHDESPSRPERPPLYRR